MDLDSFGRIYLNSKNYDIYRSDYNCLRGVFTDKELEEVRRISHLLHKTRIYKAIRKEEYVLFCRVNTPTRPRSIGVLFSLNGGNPNESDDDFLKKYGPFVEISKDWYTSEKLSYNCRTMFPLPVPQQSLINCSETK